MTILDLVPNLKRTAATRGGEYSGPCPWCAGRDRFKVWPGQGPTGRYWCRGCHRSGDGIQLLRDPDGLGYRTACDRLGIMPSLSWKPTWTVANGHYPGLPGKIRGPSLPGRA